MAKTQRACVANVFPSAAVIGSPMGEVLQSKIQRFGKLLQSGARTVVANDSAHLTLLPESHYP